MKTSVELSMGTEATRVLSWLKARLVMLALCVDSEFFKKGSKRQISPQLQPLVLPCRHKILAIGRKGKEESPQLPLLGTTRQTVLSMKPVPKKFELEWNLKDYASQYMTSNCTTES
jgi:hypothetical protein